MYVQEDELTALQESLKALSAPAPAPAQPSKQPQATPGRLAIPEQPPSTCLSAGAAIDRNRQEYRNADCQPVPDRSGKPSNTAQAPRMTTLATLQQPSPMISLVHSSGAPDPDNRGRQPRTPQFGVTWHCPTGVYSSDKPFQTAADATMREDGASHFKLQQTSRSRAVFRNPSMPLQEHQLAKGQKALMDSLKSTTSHVPIEYNAQGGVHRPPKQLRQSLMQEPAGTAGRPAGRAGAVCIMRPSAPAALQQQETSPRQPSEPEQPAIPPLLEPSPYIVEEPDSPTQEPVDRSWGFAAKQQKAMPSCLITETTITRKGLFETSQFSSLLVFGQSCHM